MSPIYPGSRTTLSRLPINRNVIAVPVARPSTGLVVRGTHGGARLFRRRQERILRIVAVNYRLAQFPTHLTMPHRTGTDTPDLTREAVHPQHLDDVLAALDTLRWFGVSDDSYLLSGTAAERAWRCRPSCATRVTAACPIA